VSLKNNLIESGYINKKQNLKPGKYSTTKVMKSHNLSYNEKANVLLKGYREKSNDSQGGNKKKRSVSPIGKNLANKYIPNTQEHVFGSNRHKVRSGSRK
jgi:predicted transcriptional regulator